jgi:hypothetical protein
MSYIGVPVDVQEFKDDPEALKRQETSLISRTSAPL